MLTITEMIRDCLRQIDERYEAEVSTPQKRASGGVVHDPVAAALVRAKVREEALWIAIGADRVHVWTPEGVQPLSDITTFVSKARMLRRLGQTPDEQPVRRAMRIIEIEASRQSDREAHD